MNTERNTIKLIIALLFFFSMVSFSGNLFAQSGSGEAEGEEAQRVEDERMTKEGQAALVAASEALQVEDFATAEKILVDYLATDPTYKPELLYTMLGVAYFNQEKFSEAANIFKDAYELFPEKTDFLTNQTQSVVMHAQKNDDKQAYIEGAKLFEKCYEEIPGKDLENLRNAALCYYAAEELTDAKRIFIEIFEAKSEPDLEILDTIYKICEELGQKDEMRKYLYQMMDINPLKNEYWLLLGQMYYETNDYLNIAATLEIAYAIKPPEKSELETLLGLYTYLNVPLRTTKTLLKNSDRLSLDDNDNKRIINGYYATNRTDKAVSYIDQLNNKKKDAELMIQKANMLLEARKNEEAIKAAESCIAFDPDQGSAYLIKGYAAWDMGDWQLAKEAFEKASNFNELKSTAIYHLAAIESLEEAKTDLEIAIEEASAAAGGTTELVPAE